MTQQSANLLSAVSVFATILVVLLVLNVALLVLNQYVLGINSLKLVWLTIKMCWRRKQRRKVPILPIEAIQETHGGGREEGGEPTVEATVRQMLGQEIND